MLDGRYRIGKIIGVGGMGRVYLANDTRLANRPVAVKEMMVGEGVHERRRWRISPAKRGCLAPLSHPGIPNLIDYFAERGRHYLVMEYIAGGDLQGWLDQRGAGARVPRGTGAALGARDSRRAVLSCTARARRSFIAT